MFYEVFGEILGSQWNRRDGYFSGRIDAIIFG